MRRRTTSSQPAHPNPTRLTRFAQASGCVLAATGLAVGVAVASAGPAAAAPEENLAVTAPTNITAMPVEAQSTRSAIASARAEAVSRATNIRAAVVAKAMAQVGDDYVAGAEGPNAFDCSGLVVYSWRSAGGVRLEHYSYAQYKQTQRVSLKDAVPGDLAFYFRNGAHHVGIYIGKGKIVNASDYGVGVIVSDVLSPWGKAHFSGMGRVKIPVKATAPTKA